MSAIRLVPPGYHSGMPPIAALVVVAFVAMLAAAELLRAYGSPSADAWRRRLEVAAVPLLFCTVVVVTVRLAPLGN